VNHSLHPSRTIAAQRLRAAGHSVTEIADALARTQTPLNRTEVWELLVAEGHERLGLRAPAERGAPARDHPPRDPRNSGPPGRATIGRIQACTERSA